MHKIPGFWVYGENVNSVNTIFFRIKRVWVLDGPLRCKGHEAHDLFFEIMRPTIIHSRACADRSVRVQEGQRMESDEAATTQLAIRSAAAADASRGDANAYSGGTTALPHQHLQASGGCNQQAGTRRMLNLFCSFFSSNTYESCVSLYCIKTKGVLQPHTSTRPMRIGTCSVPEKEKYYKPQKANPLSYYSRFKQPKWCTPAWIQSWISSLILSCNSTAVQLVPSNKRLLCSFQIAQIMHMKSE